MNLVVGGQSLIGAAIIRTLEGRSAAVWATTRKADLAGPTVLYLDLAQVEIPWSGKSFDIAYVVAAISRFSDCEQQPVRTRKINVTNTLAVCENLLRNGTFVVYVSSNAVFDGKVAYPGETALTVPTTEYGRQKAEVEEGLLGLARSVGVEAAVVRLTKLVSAKMPLFSGWFDALTTGHPVNAFANAGLSPVSMPFLMQFLLEVARQRKGGIFHCTGAEDVSYAEFSRKLSVALGCPPDLVNVRDATSVEMLFRPQHSSLGTEVTRQTLGLGAQPLTSAIADLVAEYRTLQMS